ncbi:chemotaxis protein CheA [Novosphingobium sp. FKTRR1]|uniref:chemotaxis protein CheA n=1 Tax=Novosphingobium sp. FKTRR1 TaxID=2879118 RepID=UPI001CF0CDC2|nr:chemotaxis protein CheA [Novosphingobium sp. FKTRR1]
MIHSPINPLLAQFLAEAEELLEGIGAQIMVLETRPGEPAAMNELFRLVHTMKGNSGLFDLPAMTRVLHAAEDLLDKVRQGKLALTRDHVDTLLAAMDFVSGMCAQLATRGEVGAQAAHEVHDGAAAALAQGLRALSGEGGQEDVAVPAAPPPEQGIDVPAEAMAAAARHGGALHFLRYQPEEDCFFRGDDPFHTARHTPQVVWQRIIGARALPALGELDPYRCLLGFEMLSAAPLAGIEAHFRYAMDRVALCPLTPAAADDGLDRAVLAEALAAQRRIVALTDDAPWRAARLSAAGAVVANLAALCGDPAPDLPEACAAALAGNSDALLAIIDRLASPAPSAAPVAAAAAAPAPADDPVDAVSPHPSHARSLRVDQGKIDRLMGLIGEMVVARNALPFLAQRAEKVYGNRDMAREIKSQHAVINRVTEEMQDAIMRIRMMPVSVVFQRFPRLVRDVSRKLGKDVELVLEGEDTEADKAIIEALADPLIHILRNSLDHGFETPAERRANGKPATGRLTIRAHQEGDRILLDITDDGRGIDPVRIRTKAVEKGLVDAATAEAMDDAAAIQLIFAAGFSTAEAISDLSGRGVGMDAVRSAIEALHGDVALSSTTGSGTHLRLTLPLSMAVTRVLVLEAAGQLFAMPVDMVIETTRLSTSEIRGIKTERTILRRDRILPIRELNDLLGIPRPARIDDDGEQSLLVARLGENVVALVVDGFRETLDVIQKPLTGVLAGIPAYSGATLMGDGAVLLVLNPRMLL